jgi:hypothetical protein
MKNILSTIIIIISVIIINNIYLNCSDKFKFKIEIYNHYWGKHYIIKDSIFKIVYYYSIGYKSEILEVEEIIIKDSVIISLLDILDKLDLKKIKKYYINRYSIDPSSININIKYKRKRKEILLCDCYEKKLSPLVDFFNKLINNEKDKIIYNEAVRGYYHHDEECRKKNYPEFKKK